MDEEPEPQDDHPALLTLELILLDLTWIRLPKVDSNQIIIPTLCFKVLDFPLVTFSPEKQPVKKKQKPYFVTYNQGKSCIFHTGLSALCQQFQTYPIYSFLMDTGQQPALMVAFGSFPLQAVLDDMARFSENRQSWPTISAQQGEAYLRNMRGKRVALVRFALRLSCISDSGALQSPVARGEEIPVSRSGCQNVRFTEGARENQPRTDGYFSKHGSAEDWTGENGSVTRPIYREKLAHFHSYKSAIYTSKGAPKERLSNSVPTHDPPPDFYTLESETVKNEYVLGVPVHRPQSVLFPPNYRPAEGNTISGTGQRRQAEFNTPSDRTAESGTYPRPAKQPGYRRQTTPTEVSRDARPAHRLPSDFCSPPDHPAASSQHSRPPQLPRPASSSRPPSGRAPGSDRPPSGRTPDLDRPPSGRTPDPDRPPDSCWRAPLAALPSDEEDGSEASGASSGPIVSRLIQGLAAMQRSAADCRSVAVQTALSVNRQRRGVGRGGRPLVRPVRPRRVLRGRRDAAARLSAISEEPVAEGFARRRAAGRPGASELPDTTAVDRLSRGQPVSPRRPASRSPAARLRPVTLTRTAQLRLAKHMPDVRHDLQAREYIRRRERWLAEQRRRVGGGGATRPPPPPPEAAAPGRGRRGARLLAPALHPSPQPLPPEATPAAVRSIGVQYSLAGSSAGSAEASRTAGGPRRSARQTQRTGSAPSSSSTHRSSSRHRASSQQRFSSRHRSSSQQRESPRPRSSSQHRVGSAKERQHSAKPPRAERETGYPPGGHARRVEAPKSRPVSPEAAERLSRSQASHSLTNRARPSESSARYASQAFERDSSGATGADGDVEGMPKSPTGEKDEYRATDLQSGRSVSSEKSVGNKGKTGGSGDGRSSSGGGLPSAESDTLQSDQQWLEKTASGERQRASAGASYSAQAAQNGSSSTQTKPSETVPGQGAPQKMSAPASRSASSRSVPTKIPSEVPEQLTSSTPTRSAAEVAEDAFESDSSSSESSSESSSSETSSSRGDSATAGAGAGSEARKSSSSSKGGGSSVSEDAKTPEPVVKPAPKPPSRREATAGGEGGAGAGSAGKVASARDRPSAAGGDQPRAARPASRRPESPSGAAEPAGATRHRSASDDSAEIEARIAVFLRQSADKQRREGETERRRPASPPAAPAAAAAPGAAWLKGAAPAGAAASWLKEWRVDEEAGGARKRPVAAELNTDSVSSYAPSDLDGGDLLSDISPP